MRTIIFVIALFYCFHGFCQSDRVTVEQAVALALKNNDGIKAASLDLESQRQLRKTGFDLPKTNASLLYGQYNSYAKQDNNFTITQSIPFTSLGSQAGLNRSLVASSELNKAKTENELAFQVKQVFYQLVYSRARYELLLQQDSLYEGFLKSAAARYKSGEANLLEQTTAETQRNEVKNRLRENEANVSILRTQLKTLMNATVLPEIEYASFTTLSLPNAVDSTTINSNPSMAYMRQQVEVAKSYKKVEAAKFAPDFLIGYFNQTLIDVVNTESGAIATKSDRFTGFQVGLSIPLWFVPHQARVKAAEYSKQSATSRYQYGQAQLQGELQQVLQAHERNLKSLEYYQSSALPNADLILRQSQLAFRNGEIDYAAYLLGIRSALSIKESYLQTISDYNQNIIYIEFLSGNK